MKFGLLCKRYYTNKDLIQDRFGRLYHLPDQLGKLGHQGLVIAADYRSNKYEVLDIPGVEFHSLPLRLKNIVSFIQQSHRQFHSFKPDVLIASGDSHFGYLGLKIAQRLQIPFIFDIYDDYRVFGSNRLPGMKNFFTKTVKKSSAIICASHVLSRQLAKLNPNVAIIENGVDPDLFRPIPIEEARHTLNISENDTIIGFFGSIDRDHGVVDLLEAATILRKDIPNIRVLLAGRNTLGLNLTRTGVDYRGLLPQDKIPILINSCDVVTLPLQSSPQCNVSNSCKLSEYLACGVPIVATSVGDNPELLHTLSNTLCEPNNPADLARAILQQLETPKSLPLPNRFTWSFLGKVLEDKLSKLI